MEQAAKFWRQAAKVGHAAAKEQLLQHAPHLAEERADGSPPPPPPPSIEDRLKERRAAINDVRRRAKAGSATAQFELGRLLLRGSGMAKSPAKAARSFKDAADQGHTKAEAILGAMYQDGFGVEKW